MIGEPGAPNATLTAEELAACRPVANGSKARAFCPFHGSDHQRSLAINLETGRFHCFQCGAWGYTEEARQRWRAARSLTREEVRDGRSAAPGEVGTRSRDDGRSWADHQLVPSPSCWVMPQPTPVRVDLRELLASYWSAWSTRLGKTLGRGYLRQRGIPLELALAYRLGYAAPGKWAHQKDGKPVRDWKWGRIVVPHERPDGTVVNLYGRAVDNDTVSAKEARHDHLPGNRGYFNATALREGAGPLAVCEGVFDALTLIAAGHKRTVAIFGVNGWRWDWAQDLNEIVLAFDADKAGQEAWRHLARGARLRGKRVILVPPDAYGGYKDLNDAWVAGALDFALLASLGLTVTTAEGAVPAAGARRELTAE